MEAEGRSEEDCLDVAGVVGGRTPSAMRLSSKSRPLSRSGRQHPGTQSNNRARKGVLTGSSTRLNYGIMAYVRYTRMVLHLCSDDTSDSLEGWMSSLYSSVAQLIVTRIANVLRVCKRPLRQTSCFHKGVGHARKWPTIESVCCYRARRAYIPHFMDEPRNNHHLQPCVQTTS